VLHASGISGRTHDPGAEKRDLDPYNSSDADVSGRHWSLLS